MCGIAGAVALEPDRRVEADVLRRMADCMVHRGPDGHGVWVSADGRVGFGHRRLSVIDLDGGSQPFVDRDGRASIVFNGEIYNYVELRDALRAGGASFRTVSDTEVLLRLLRSRGADCLGSLRGMFAFAAWNGDTGDVLLARDRIGKKPVYHTIRDGIFYFASSLEALAAGARFERRIDVEALDLFLSLGYIPAPRTIWRSVRKLGAGSLLRVGAGRIEERIYWQPPLEPEPFEGTFEEAVDALDELLGDAVNIRLRSDVPLGVFLSGGVDSSLVAAMASRRTPGKVLTFCVRFEEQSFDESRYARAVAFALGTEHRTIVTRRDLMSLVPEVVRHFGEPYGDSSALPTWRLAEATRRHVTVALGGDGGDEGFGGYNWYRTAIRLGLLERVVPRFVARSAAGIGGGGLGRIPALGRLRRAARALLADAPTRVSQLRTSLDDAEVARLYAGDLRTVRSERGDRAADLLGRVVRESGGSVFRRMVRTDIRTYLADDLMPKVDVATMAHSLEARAPLLDHTVLEFALRLPDEWLTGWRSGKVLLKALVARYLPSAMFRRPKRGFSVPLEVWFADERNALERRLTDGSRLRETGWFQADGIRALLREHQRGDRNHAARLYNLLVLDEWLGQQF